MSEGIGFIINVRCIFKNTHIIIELAKKVYIAVVWRYYLMIIYVFSHCVTDTIVSIQTNKKK